MKKKILLWVFIIVLIMIGLLLVANFKNGGMMSAKKDVIASVEKIDFPVLKTIDKYEFKEKMTTGEYQMIDIRTSREISQGKILESALEIDFYGNNFAEKINQLPKDKKYLIYCRSGNRSSQVLRLMKKMDFVEVYELGGGINSWRR